MPLDLDFVRAQFPALTGPAADRIAHFENAGGSYAAAPVIDRLTRFYTARKVQPYGVFPASAAAGAEMDEARDRLAAILGVGAEMLHFGPSTTQNAHVLAGAFRQVLSAGDAIVVTNQDHEANTGFWRRLADAGIEVREWQVDGDSGMLDPADLERLLDDRVRLVAFPHVSNILGAVNPVAAICATVRAAGAVSCVDGVSFAPHGLPDLGALGADIYLFSAYKTFGPHQGIMVVAPDLVARLPNEGHGFNAGFPTKRLTPAGPDHAQIAASAGMADYFDAFAAHHGLAGGNRPPTDTVAALQQAHERALLAPLLDWLGERNDIRLLGPEHAADRVPTVAIALNRPGRAAAAALAEHGIAAGGGHFYAPRLLRALGIDPDHGVLRISFVHYTAPAEIERLVDALDAVL